MDDQFDFVPPVEFLPCLTWEQIMSKENHWANPQMPRSFPRFMSIPTKDGDNSPSFKTQMCWRFKIRGCRNGDGCKFAHSIEEIRRPPRADRVCFPRKDCNSGSNPNRYGRFKESQEKKLHTTKLYSQHSENWKRKCIYSHGDEELKELGIGSWEAGGKSVTPAPFKPSPRLSEQVPTKINQQQGSSLPRAADLTLAKCKRIYGDWID